MSYYSVYIHFVWRTKYRIPFLNSSELRQKMWKHMRANALKKRIHIDFINGYKDHCLVSLGPKQTISDVIRLIKGESSFWINKNGLCSEHLKWQDEYYAISVSKSAYPRVRNYIRKKESHHRAKSYEIEEKSMIEKYGFEKYQ